MKQLKTAWPWILLSAILVVLDQLVKNWVQQAIPLYGVKPFLPGLLELTYVQNTGAAFSIFREHTWILTLISALASLIILVLLLRRALPGRLGQLALSLVLGGAVGNLIDRYFYGFVVDMFNLQFMNFAVFNVADIGISVGGVLLCVYVLFFWKKTEERAP